MKRLVKLVCGVIVCSLMWLMLCECLNPPEPRPQATMPARETRTVRIYATDTYYASTSDGYIKGSSSSYSTARSTSSSCDNTSNTAYIGQRYTGSLYEVSRAYLGFDTGSLPDDAVVSAATLYVCADQDNSATNFTIRVYRYAWSEPLCNSQESNYDGAYGGSATYEGALRDTSLGWDSGTYYNMSVSASGINLVGDTKYSLVSSRDVGNTQPTGNEFVQFRTNEYTGTGSDPYLEITYTVPTPTPTPTFTPTPTPTPTPMCPVAILEDTTWGPGLVRISCNVGVDSGAVLTVTAGTEIKFTGDYKIDVFGKLYAVGTAADPITITHETATTSGSWGYVQLRHTLPECTPSALEYVNIFYGDGINDGCGATIRYTGVYSSTYGLATWADTDMISSTLQYNGVGLLIYYDAEPSISWCNICDNEVDAWLDQYTSVEVPNCWWGSAPPDDDKVIDYMDDSTLGYLDRSTYESGYISW